MMSKQKVKSLCPFATSAAGGSHSPRSFFIDATPAVPGEQFPNHVPLVLNQDGIAKLTSSTAPLPWVPPCKLVRYSYPAGTSRLPPDEIIEADRNLEILDEILEGYIDAMRRLTEAAVKAGVKFVDTPEEVKHDNPDEAVMLLRRVRQMVDKNLLSKQPNNDSYAVIRNVLYCRLSCCHSAYVRLVRFPREYVYALSLLGGPNLLNERENAARANLIMHYSGFGQVNLLP